MQTEMEENKLLVSSRVQEILKKKEKHKTIILMTVLAIMISVVGISIYSHADTTKILTPDENQYLELKATSIIEKEDGNKQLIMELWGHDLEFKGFSVRFSYDSDKYKLSDITTNEVTDDCEKYFKFENEFSDVLEFFDIDYRGLGDGVEAMVSFTPPINTSEHVIEKENVGKLIHTRRFIIIRKIKF